MRRLNVIGTGGFAKQILSLLDRSVEQYSRICFAEDEPSLETLAGREVRPLANVQNDESYVIAISNPGVRERLAMRLEEAGLSAAGLTSPDARISNAASVSPGAIICDFAIVEPMAKIGSHFHANVYAFVAHDCIIGDCVTFGPRATCNGNVHVGDGAFIGAGALIRQGAPGKPLTIGAGATIGMGALVTKDVPEGAVVVGNPARPMR